MSQSQTLKTGVCFIIHVDANKATSSKRVIGIQTCAKITERCMRYTEKHGLYSNSGLASHQTRGRI